MAQGTARTNVMRLLDQAGVKYRSHSYESDGAVSGTEVARLLGVDADKVFKTLVTVGKSGAHYVFVIPAKCELELRKAASAVNEKSVEMVRSKELLPLTGYVHGGCSPIGMKKRFATVVDESAVLCDTIIVSGGRIGVQVELTAQSLHTMIPFTYQDVTA